MFAAGTVAVHAEVLMTAEWTLHPVEFTSSSDSQRRNRAAAFKMSLLLILLVSFDTDKQNC